MAAGAPTEAKVYAATLGSGAGTILSGFVLWVLGVTFWHSSTGAGDAVAAAAAVPAPVAGVVTLALAIGGTYVAGHAAPHTARPDLTPGPQDPPVAPVDGPAQPEAPIVLVPPVPAPEAPPVAPVDPVPVV